MSYFNQDFNDFFQELEANNSKEWFHANKKRYEKSVKAPMVDLVRDVAAAMHKIDNDFVVDPKKCIGRINRDIRFSKDKTPYNVHYYAHITKGEKNDPFPGIAFRFGGNDAGIMAGFYMPGKERIQRIRELILNNTAEFKRLYSAKTFADTFGTIKGEANKRLPSEFAAIQDEEPLIANKQFYYVSEFDEKLALREDLLEVILDHWKAAKPLNEFLGR